MDDDMKKKIELLEFLDNFKYIKRACVHPKDYNSYENDAEHSWHLAMMILIFIDKYPELDREKCLIFALIHDLVELYAGDVCAYNKEKLIGKKEREFEAFQKLCIISNKSFKENYEKWFYEYENLKSKEAKFVYQLDKLHPFIINVLGKGKTWEEIRVEKNEILELKKEKIDNEFGLFDIFLYYYEIAEKNNYFFKKDN
jgi:putative hydrolase of HD superfamily